MNRPVRKLPLLALAALLLAVPALAAPGSLTVAGVITAVNGNLVSLNGNLVTVDVTNATIIGRGDGAPTGVAALVVGAPAVATITAKGADGSLVASTFLVGAAEAIELRGALTAVDTGAGTLTLLGLTVKTDAHTAFTGATSRGPVHGLADLAAGDAVQVEAIRSGGDLVAQHVHAGTSSGNDTTFELHGRVDAIGTDSWTISGKTVKVTASTKISGSPAVGDTVEAKGTLAADGTMTATSIEKSGRPTPNMQEIHGTLEVKATDSWTISGKVVKVTATTIIRNDPKVGDRVGGVARKESDGSLTALVLVGMGTSGSDDGGGHH